VREDGRMSRVERAAENKKGEERRKNKHHEDKFYHPGRSLSVFTTNSLHFSIFKIGCFSFAAKLEILYQRATKSRR
jgi:hypothetical protein